MLTFLVKCNYCKSTCKPKDSALILERKMGKLTGREYRLCPICRKKYFDREIQNIDFDNFKDNARDKLTEWNQEVTPLWTPD